MISWGIHFNPKQTCSPLLTHSCKTVGMPCGMKKGWNWWTQVYSGCAVLLCFLSHCAGCCWEPPSHSDMWDRAWRGQLQKGKVFIPLQVEEIIRDLCFWSLICPMLYFRAACPVVNKHCDAEESTSRKLSECHISSTFCSELHITFTIKTWNQYHLKQCFSGVFSEERNACLLELFHIYAVEAGSASLKCMNVCARTRTHCKEIFVFETAVRHICQHIN